MSMEHESPVVSTTEYVDEYQVSAITTFAGDADEARAYSRWGLRGLLTEVDTNEQGMALHWSVGYGSHSSIPQRNDQKGVLYRDSIVIPVLAGAHDSHLEIVGKSWGDGDICDPSSPLSLVLWMATKGPYNDAMANWGGMIMSYWHKVCWRQAWRVFGDSSVLRGASIDQ